MDDLLALDGFSSSFSFLPSCIPVDIKHYFTHFSKPSRARIRRTAISFFKRSYVHNRMASSPEKKYSGTALVSLQRPDLIISASRASMFLRKPYNRPSENDNLYPCNPSVFLMYTLLYFKLSLSLIMPPTQRKKNSAFYNI